MRPLYATYVSLVRAALWNEQVNWPAEMSDDLLLLNAQQGTGTLVYPSVLAQTTLSVYARTQMKGVYMQNIQQQIPLQRTLEIAWQALEKAGIRATLMKGAGLAAYYPEPQMRFWGDIDLFVGPDQYHPACAVMRETFPKALKFDEELDHYKHYNLIADGVSIEIHRVTVGLQHPVDERRYAKMEAFGMAHPQEMNINGLAVRVPDPTFNALLVFLHSWEHMLTAGGNMRQLCDLALLLKNTSEAIDFILLKRWLRSLKLLKVWQLYMCILVQYLGLPESSTFGVPQASEACAEMLLEDLLDGKMAAPKSTDAVPKGRIARKLHTMKERFANARRIKKYCPSYARHMNVTTLLNGARRFFAKDRHWE